MRGKYQAQHRPAGGQRTVSEDQARSVSRTSSPVRHRRSWRARRGDRPVRRPVIAALLILVGIGGPFAAVRGDIVPPHRSGTADLAAAVRIPADRQRDEVSRATQRVAPTPSASTSPQPSASPSASPSPRPKPKVAKTKAVVTRPVPVGGLSQVQMDHAATIVRVGEKLKLSTQAFIIAISTALQESQLLNLANYGVAESLNLPHDGVGGDHDSVGLFQQRPSSGWGTVEELMDPATSATKFYDALMQIPGWQSMSVTEAAQAVQVSAFPDAYAQQVSLATLVVGALT